ncbi:hypothetical protein CsatA_020971 [Cannabis sativa]
MSWEGECDEERRQRLGKGGIYKRWRMGNEIGFEMKRALSEGISGQLRGPP